MNVFLALFFSLTCFAKSPEDSVWFYAKKPKGIVLVVHGLNLKPSKMNPISEFLVKDGYDVYRISLTGHKGDVEALQTITADRWMQDLEEGFYEIKKRGQNLKLKLYIVCQSLGCLANLNLMDRNPDVNYEKMIQISPAIERTFSAKVMGFFLERFEPSSVGKRINQFFDLPLVSRIFTESKRKFDYSKSISDLRSVDKLTKESYRALFVLMSEYKAERSNIPSLVFMNYDDEFVSYPGVREFISKNMLTNWKFVEISTKDTELTIPYGHYIFDQRSLGKRGWLEMKSTISKFISGSKQR